MSEMSEDLYTVVYEFVDLVLNTERPTLAETPIIKSEQDAPPPTTGPYIVVGHAPKATPNGRSYKADPDGDGVQELKSDYTLTLEVWEVNSDGELLAILLDNMDRQDTKDAFIAAGFSFMSTAGDVQDLDAVQGSKWRHEKMVELMFNTTRKITYTPGLIEVVEGVGTFPHQAKAGNITVNLDL